MTGPAAVAALPGEPDPVVVVGAGLAGLTTALALAPQPCLVLTGGPLATETSSVRAQGGIAAAVGPDDDPGRHAADTLAAGAGLCEPGAVRAITAAAPDAVAWLTALGARFDRRPDGRLLRGLEGAHSRHRIVHAAGDGTGREVLRAVTAAALAAPSVTIRQGARAVELLTVDGAVRGVVVERDGVASVLRTSRVVLATGGVGGLYAGTTNPLGSRGQGLALALRAGAELRDVEMVQFHPTALAVGLDPMPLVSEAVRGAGARLVTAAGADIVADPLAPRDVVARAVDAALRAGRRVHLDARAALGASFAARFPQVAAACRAAGLDPATDLIPVRPAEHYHMGGVSVDLRGRTTVPGLWACGEVASSGLHGANRLASNSLLEAVVLGRWVAQDLAGTAAARAGAPLPAPTVVPPRRAAAPRWLRALLTSAAGVLRDEAGLAAAVDRLRDEAPADDDALVALAVCWAALHRRESRGAHTRTDHPEPLPARHLTLTLADLVPTPAGAVAARA